MAYCEYCGKEMPKSGVCSCKLPAAPFVPEIRVSTSDRKEGGIKNFVRDNKVLLIVGAALLAVIITVIVIVYNFTGSRGAARKYAKNVFSRSGGKTYYSMTLPDKLYDSLNGDKFDDMVDDFNDENKKAAEDYKVKLKKIKKTEKLSKNQLNGAEKAFAQNAAKYDRSFAKASYSAKKGYIYELTYKIKDRQTKKTKKYTKEVAAVKFNGEGWKIIDIDTDGSLEEHLSKLGEEDDAKESE